MHVGIIHVLLHRLVCGVGNQIKGVAQQDLGGQSTGGLPAASINLMSTSSRVFPTRNSS